MRNSFHFTTALALLLALTACATPGAQLKTGNKVIVNQPGAAPFDINQHVELHPITPTLLQDLRKATDFSRPAAATASHMPSYEYRVGPGDVLNIVVWGHPEINRAVGLSPMTSSTSLMGGVDGQVQNTSSGTVVDSQGSIFYPYVGRVHVAGQSAPQIRTMLTSRLGRYLRNPQVDVTVAAYLNKTVQVGGALVKPSRLSITNIPMTVLDAVNLAGGLTEAADPTRVTITREGGTRIISLYDIMQHGDMGQNQLLRSGDVVYVPTNDQRQVHIMGEVIQQSSLKLPPSGLSLTAALGEAKGMNQQSANASGVFVIRPLNAPDTGKIADVYQLNLKDATAFALGTQFQLRPDDVVFVTVAPISHWGRVVSQIIPSLTTLGVLTNAFK